MTKDADGDWIKRDARYASLSKATAFVGWNDELNSARLQANHAMSLKDDADHEIERAVRLAPFGARQQRFELGDLARRRSGADGGDGRGAAGTPPRRHFGCH